MFLPVSDKFEAAIQQDSSENFRRTSTQAHNIHKNNSLEAAVLKKNFDSKNQTLFLINSSSGLRVRNSRELTNRLLISTSSGFYITVNRMLDTRWWIFELQIYANLLCDCPEHLTINAVELRNNYHQLQLVDGIDELIPIAIREALAEKI